MDESFTASSLGDDNSIEVSADGNVMPPASAVHFPLSASGVSSAVTDPAVTMQSNYNPVVAMNCGLSQAKNYDHFGVSPATSFCPREFDPSVRDGSIIGHQQEVSVSLVCPSFVPCLSITYIDFVASCSSGMSDVN